MTVFELIVLGCSGGPLENNLSGYLVSPAKKSSYVALDGGTMLVGLEVAYKKGHFGKTPFLEVFQKHIVAYCISHSHLDHVAGLVMASQVDIPKTIFGSDVTLNAIRDHLFNGAIWPNYGNEGKDPIGFYRYQRLPFQQKTMIEGSEMSVEAFPLKHAKDCPSTCFLLEWQGEYLVYFGDTASDDAHGGDHLKVIWKRLAPLVKAKKLKGMLLECSYPSEEKGPGVSSHLNTVSIGKELESFSHIAGSPLSGLKVVVTHRKDAFQNKSDQKELIRSELKHNNSLGIDYIFPVQGEKILF